MDEVTKRYLELAQFLIDDLPPGELELSKILGEHWEELPSKKQFGIDFKHEVESGNLRNIEFRRTDKGSNHRFYQILEPK